MFGSSEITGKARVQEDDTLLTMAARLFGDPSLWQRLVSANKGIDPLNLKPGSEINVPLPPTVGGGQPGGYPTATPVGPTPQQPPAPAGPPAPPTAPPMPPTQGPGPMPPMQGQMPPTQGPGMSPMQAQRPDVMAFLSQLAAQRMTGGGMQQRLLEQAKREEEERRAREMSRQRGGF